jgi:hypothetical protein
MEASTMRKVRGVVLVGFALLMSSASALAHHSFTAEFDGSKLVAYTGVLTKLEWTNPHGWFYLDIKDESGTVRTWAFELASPNVLRRADEQTRSYFLDNMGKVLSVTASPAKNGTNKAAADQVKFMDGRIMPMGGKRYTGDLDSEQILRSLK